MAKLTRPRFLILYALIPLGFLVASSSERQFRAGVPIACLGLLTRLWANGYVGHRKVNQTDRGRGDAKVGYLITGGPYAYVRHPLYVGTFLIAIGFGVIVGHPLMVLLALAALAMIYRSKIAEEEQTLQGEWGATFQRYRQAVSAWLPRLAPYTPQVGQWSWRGIAASKEWKTSLWVWVALIALYAREEWWQEHELLGGRHGAKHAAFIGLAIALMAADGAIELWRLRSKRIAQGQGRGV